MNTVRIKMAHRWGDPTPANVYDDFDWVRHHEHELLEKYGECSIIVYKHQVIGVGQTYEAAVADAEYNLPPDQGEITPIHERLRQRHPFSRVYPLNE